MTIKISIKKIMYNFVYYFVCKNTIMLLPKALITGYTIEKSHSLDVWVWGFKSVA